MRTVVSPIPGSSPCVLAPFSKFSQRTNRCSHIERTDVAVAGPTSGWLGTRHGSKLPLLLGTAICAVSFSFLAAAHSERWEIYAGTC